MSNNINNEQYSNGKNTYTSNVQKKCTYNFFLKNALNNKFIYSLVFLIILIICLSTVDLLLTYIFSYFNLYDYFSKEISLTILLLASTLISYLIGIVLPSLLLKKFFNVEIKYRTSLKNIILCLILGIIMQPVASLLAAIGEIFTTQNVAGEIIESYKLVNPIVLCICFALIPAVVEEFAFRGLIYNFLNQKYSVMISSIITGIMFGIMHFDIQQFFYASILGIMFSFIYNKTKSLICTITIHFTINFSQLMLGLYFYNFDVLENSTNIEISPFEILITVIELSIIIVPIFILLYKLIYKHLDNFEIDNFSKNNNLI